MDVNILSGMSRDPSGSVFASASASGSAGDSMPANSSSSSSPVPSSVAPSTASYTSPIITIDSTTGSVILQFRNGSTGEEISQTPSKTALQYRHSAHVATGGEGHGNEGVALSA